MDIDLGTITELHYRVRGGTPFPSGRTPATCGLTQRAKSPEPSAILTHPPSAKESASVPPPNRLSLAQLRVTPRPRWPRPAAHSARSHRTLCLSCLVRLCLWCSRKPLVTPRVLTAGAIAICFLSMSHGWHPAAQGGHTSSVAFMPDETAVCAVNQDNDSISIWRFGGDGKVVEIDVGREPRTLAVSPDGKRIYVACQSSQTFSVVDVDSGATIRDVELGGQPYGVVLSDKSSRAFVSQYAGGYIDGKYVPGIVAVVDVATGHLAERIPVSRSALGNGAGPMNGRCT